MRDHALHRALPLLGALILWPALSAGQEAEEGPQEEAAAPPEGQTPEDAEPSPDLSTAEEPLTEPPVAEEPRPEPPRSDEAETTSEPGGAEAEDDEVLLPVETSRAEEETASPPPPSASPSGDVERVLTTAAEEFPYGLLVWQDERFGARVKPMVQIASGFVLYAPQSSTNPDLAMRLSTLLLARIGLEGELFGFLSFRIAFERNVGFSIARNGPVGTSVWEGTASLQAVENWIRLQRWGLSVTAGIIVDPASVDFVSDNILDLLGKDPYVRDPALVSGLNQGQGVLLRYTWRGLSVGASYTGGNPLTSSLSFGFGGNVGATGTLYSLPLRAFSNGMPGSDVHMHAISPSIAYESDSVGVRVTGQLLFVDADVTSEDDKSLFGYNLRATAQLRVLDGMLRFFAGGAYRQNEQLAIPDLTTYREEAYQGWVDNGGLDFNYGPFSVGGNYYFLRSVPSNLTTISTHFINVGMTYWLRPPHASIGLRWGRSMQTTEAEAAETIEITTDSAMLSVRLLI